MQFFDDQDTLVTDALAGYLTRDHGEDLAVLDGFPHLKVLVRGGPEDGRVAVVSGGGSGHEPAHVGDVAEGLLSAAGCGDGVAPPGGGAGLAAGPAGAGGGGGP